MLALRDEYATALEENTGYNSYLCSETFLKYGRKRI